MHRTCCLRLTAVLAVLLCAAPAIAQSIEPERGDSVFDKINELIDNLGERTEELLAPYIGSLNDFADEDWSGLQTHTRAVEYNSGALRQDLVVDFDSDLAEAHVRIESWENPIVQLIAEITVGAESADAAAEIAEQVEIIINETAGGDRVDIRPRYPDTRAHGRVNLSTFYTLKVPPTANIRCQNGFGDTSIDGVGGTVVLDSKFGVVDLKDIGGRAQVRAWGEFDLRAQGLRNGGTFDLQSTIAEFANCAGELQISSFLGSVSVARIPANEIVRLDGDGGAVTCVVPDGADPAVDARALYGAIHSDIPLDRSTQGGLQIAKVTPSEPTHTIELDAMFADVTVRRESAFIPEATPSTADDTSVYNNEELVFESGANEQLRIDAIPGNVRVRGAETDELVVKVTRWVRVKTPDDARPALEALAFRHERIEGVTRLMATVASDYEALGVLSYRVDLDITCPKTSQVELFAEDGSTTIEQLEGPVRIEQEKGSITLENVHAQNAEIEVVNKNGHVNVFDTMGNVSIITAQGNVNSRNVSGQQGIRAEGGNTLVESPVGPFTVRQQNGNVRVYSLGGIAGDGAVETTDGDISILIPTSADVVYHVAFENGAVFPRNISLHGTIEGNKGSYTRSLNEGTHRLDLNATNGNVYID